MANNTGKKYGGRNLGTQNKVTKELKELITQFLENEWLNIQEDFKALQSKDRLFFYEKLLAYCIPKNSPIEVEEARFVEQPLFLQTKMYEIDLDKIQYLDLKQMIEESLEFMSTKQNNKISIELPDGDLQLDCIDD